MSGFFQGAQDAFGSSEAVALARKNNFGSNYLVPFLLFVVLSPGLLLSIPPAVKANESDVKGTAAGAVEPEKVWFGPRRVTWTNTLVHAIVYVVLMRVVVTMVIPKLFTPK